MGNAEFNVAIGKSALYNNGTGGYNVAVGVEALSQGSGGTKQKM